MFNIFLGRFVKISNHNEASKFIIKKIDTDNEMVFIVPLSYDGLGFWFSSNAVY